MCGITGIFFKNGRLVDKNCLERMTNSIVHRGPDGAGLYIDNNLGFGHRRLAIIDLSENGRQPMSSRNNRFHITFNGEIYNYKKLRDSLIWLGHQFNTETDTEVILNGFIEWGENLWEKLDGFYAIGLWDSELKKLYLARDSLGIKPLFYYDAADQVIFGSEIKAILASEAFQKKIDEQALSNYFSNFYISGTRSIINGIQQLEPGEVIEFECTRTKRRKIWSPKIDGRYSKCTLDEIEMILKQEFQKSVKRALVSDVPVGLLLSGGLDSTLILHELKELGSKNIKTYTVGFKDENFDEAKIAQKTLDFYGLRGEIIYLDDLNVIEDFEQCILHSDSLNSNFASLAEYQIFKGASPHLKVALAGMGNDELFAGYSTYQADKLRRLYRLLPKKIREIFKSIAYKIPSTNGKYSLGFMAQRFSEGSEFEIAEAHHHWRLIFTKNEQMSLLQTKTSDSFNIYKEFLGPILEDGKMDDALLIADLRAFCIDNANVLMDSLSMGFSMEIRPPFLNKELVECALNIPYKYKLAGLKTKKIIRKIYSKKIPTHILHSKKTGLIAPVSQLLRGSMRELAQDTFASNQKCPELNMKYCNNLLNEHLSGKLDHGYKLYTILTFLKWRELFMTNKYQELLSIKFNCN